MAATFKDYYETLGVPRTANEKDIGRLRRDLGLPYEAIGLIVPLVERIEELEERLASTSR